MGNVTVSKKVIEEKEYKKYIGTIRKLTVPTCILNTDFSLVECNKEFIGLFKCGSKRAFSMRGTKRHLPEVQQMYKMETSDFLYEIGEKINANGGILKFNMKVLNFFNTGIYVEVTVSVLEFAETKKILLQVMFRELTEQDLYDENSAVAPVGEEGIVDVDNPNGFLFPGVVDRDELSEVSVIQEVKKKEKLEDRLNKLRTMAKKIEDYDVQLKVLDSIKEIRRAYMGTLREKEAKYEMAKRRFETENEQKNISLDELREHLAKRRENLAKTLENNEKLEKSNEEYAAKIERLLQILERRKKLQKEYAKILESQRKVDL